jgi:hypothetical protein
VPSPIDQSTHRLIDIAGAGRRWAIRNPLKTKLSRGGGVGAFVFEWAPRRRGTQEGGITSIDTEHASFNIETVANLLHVSSAVGLPALVRVPETRRSLLSRPLDAGATGLMIPRVESRAQAEEIVRYTKFPPMGDRGVILGTAHNAYRAEDGRRFLRQANAELLLVMQIETLAGMEHVDEILSVPGLDVALIGPYDLSTRGHPRRGEPSAHGAPSTRSSRCWRHDVVPGTS